MIRPIVEHLGPSDCLVLAANDTVLPTLPPGASAITVQAAMHYDFRKWRGNSAACANFQAGVRDLGRPTVCRRD